MLVLPQGYSGRSPAPGDADAVAGLLAECVRVDGGAESTNVEHALDDWHGVDLAEEAILVLAPDGAVAGYADVVNRAFVSLSVYGYVHPEHRGRGIGAWLVGWGEDWMRGRMCLAPEGARILVKQYVISTNSGARRLLDRDGYEAVRGTYVMEIDLDEKPPEPEQPEGLAMRTFVPGRALPRPRRGGQRLAGLRVGGHDPDRHQKLPGPTSTWRTPTRHPARRPPSPPAAARTGQQGWHDRRADRSLLHATAQRPGRMTFACPWKARTPPGMPTVRALPARPSASESSARVAPTTSRPQATAGPFLRRREVPQ